MQSLILLLITLLAHVTSQQCPGMYPHPSDCDKFYQCDSSRSYLFNCPEGTLFDKTLGLCNHKYLVTCSSSISSIPPSPPTTTISVTYPWRPQTTVRPSTSVTRPSWISSTSTMSTSTKQTDMDDAPSNLIPDSEDNSGSNSEAASESGSNSGSNLPSSSNDNNPSGVSLPSESGSQSQQGSGSVTNLPSDSENLSSDGQPSGGNRPSENNPDSGSNYQPGSDSGSNLSSSSSENISDDNKPSDSNLPTNPDSDYNPDSESNKKPEIELNLPSDNEPVTRPPTDSELSNSEGSVSETSDAELSNSETPDSELSNSEVSDSEPQYSVSASSLYPCSQPGYYSEETSCDQFYVCKEVAPGVLSADRIFSCPNRYLFDPVTRLCQRESKVTCDKDDVNNLYYSGFNIFTIKLSESDLDTFFSQSLTLPRTRPATGNILQGTSFPYLPFYPLASGPVPYISPAFAHSHY